MSILRYGLDYTDNTKFLSFGPQGWLTLSFNQEPWYDDSQTDMMGTRISITGSFLISAPINPMANTSVSDTNPASALPILRFAAGAWKPRGKLSFRVNKTEMIPTSTSSLYGGGLDDKNGPLPGKLEVVQVTERTFLVNLSIVSHWAEKSANTDGGGILSNRWTDQVTIGKDFLSRRTRQGKVVVSSAAYNGATSTIDTLRSALVPLSLTPEFTRESVDIVVHPNGLELGYTTVDQEQFRLPPTFTYEAEGQMTVTTQRMGSVGRNANCTVTLRGPKKQESTPDKLVVLATKIAFQKLLQNTGFFPSKADFRENLWKNEVTVSLSGLCKPQGKVDDSFLSLKVSMRGIGKTVDSQVGPNVPNPGHRGTGNVILEAACYQDPTIASKINPLVNLISVNGPGWTGLQP